jgi:3-hydroxyacyl-CoA dehydrogenase
VQRAEPSLDESVWQSAITRGRAIAEAKVHGAAPAPYRALDILETARTGSIEDGFAAEEDALTELIMSEEFRASVYAFDLVQRRAKRPAGALDRSLARPVTKVGIVGAGLMASQLALLFARRLLVPVVLTDLDQERVDRGLSNVQAEIDKLEGKGRVSADVANRLRRLVTGSVSRSVFSDADFVIEAVFEDFEVKKQVFTELESVVRPDCVLATNTSSLSVSELAADLAHPERLVGFHFFNPVAVLPLLEIVRAERTDDASLATAFDVGGSLRKSCVLVADAPAFVVNRLLTRFLGEIMAAVDTGTPIEVADRAMAPLGLPMPPFELLGLVGPAVALHVAETLSAAFPDRFAVSPGAAARLVGAGDGLDAAEILDRALRALAQEARLLLDEGVVAEPQDIDLCLLLGAGWPFHLGGLTPYLDRTGVSEAVTGRRFLPPGVATLPEPSTESGGAADQPADPAVPGAAATSAAAAGAHLPQQVGTAPDEPDQLFSDEALVVTSGELTPRGMTLRLAMGGEVRVAFAMPLPVAQIGMFAGRPLPVPASMFTAVLVTGGAEATIGVTSVTVLSAGDGEAQLELNGTLDFGSAGLPYPDRQVTLTPTVTVAA